MRSIILPIILSLSVSACSSSSDDSNMDTGMDASMDAGMDADMAASMDTDISAGSNFRVATITASVDVPGMEVPSLVTEFDYDSAGRIETVRRSRLDTTAEPDTTTYTYGASGIETRSDGETTETFSYVNGLISQIMSSDDETRSYTYDNDGKLIGVIGDAFEGDDDCDATLIINGVGSDTTPVFEIAYTGNRLDSITGSTGDVISFEYNQQNLLSRQTRTGGCGDIVTEYTSRADGLPLTETTRYTEFDSETEEFVLTYSGDQLTQSVSTFSDSFSGIFEETTTSYTYNASDRLVGLTIADESVSNGESDTSTINVTLTYEEEGCVRQLTAYPDTALLTNLFTIPDQASLNLTCVFFLDDF